MELCRLLKILILQNVTKKDMAYVLMKEVSLTEGGFDRTTNARNVLIFGADMSFSVHATNRANHIYIMGTEFVQGINDTTIYAEKSL